MHVDLLVLLEPSVHLGELDLDEPVKLVVVVERCCGLRTAIPDDDVVDVMLLGLEGVHEILLWHVLYLEEVVGVVGLQPSSERRASANKLKDCAGRDDVHQQSVSGVDDVLAAEEDTDSFWGGLDVRELGKRELQSSHSDRMCTVGDREKAVSGREEMASAGVLAELWLSVKADSREYTLKHRPSGAP